MDLTVFLQTLLDQSLSQASKSTVILTSYGLDSLPADLAGSVTLSLASKSTVTLTSYASSHWQWT